MSKPVWIMCGPEGTRRHLYYRNDRDNIYCAECWRRDAARDLRTWIGDKHRPIKGWVDLPVDEALDIVEGRP